MPKWISWISRINPVDWAISLEGAVVNSHGAITYTIALFVFAIVSVGFCVYSFNLYRHSI